MYDDNNNIMNELNQDVLDSIFLYLKNIRDIRSFIGINKRLNERYKTEIIKYKIKLYTNTDYLLFYDFLNRYQYEPEFIDEVIAKAFICVPKFWPSAVVEMYDLRFIFELMFQGYALNKEQIKNYNPHLYIHFYNKIRECLDSNRSKTLENIEQSSYLFSLRQNPRIKQTMKNGPNFTWISILKD